MGESAFRSLYIFDCIHPTVSKIARVMGTLCKSTALRDMNSGCHLVSHISEERTPERHSAKIISIPDEVGVYARPLSTAEEGDSPSNGRRKACMPP
jgi:hypothetical protein